MHPCQTFEGSLATCWIVCILKVQDSGPGGMHMGVQNELQAFRKEIPSSTTVHLMSASIDNFQHEWL